jgi:hypothetical protein
MRSHSFRLIVFAVAFVLAGSGTLRVACAGLMITANGSSELDNDGLGPQDAQVTMTLNTVAIQSIRSATIPPNPLDPSFPGWGGSTMLFGGGSVDYGKLSGSLEAQATSNPSGYGVAKTIGNIILQFDDGATVVSNTNQPVGTPVTLGVNAQLASVATFFSSAGASNTDNLAFAEFEGHVLDVMTNQTVDFTINNSTFSGYNSTPNSLQLPTFVGDDLQISGRLSFHAEAKVGVLFFGPTDALVSIDATHTALFFIDAPSDFSIVSDSGHNYSIAVPEPSSLALIACGGMLFLCSKEQSFRK